MKTRTLLPFLALSFGLTWGLAAILILFYDQVIAPSARSASPIPSSSSQCIRPALLAYSLSGATTAPRAWAGSFGV